MSFIALYLICLHHAYIILISGTIVFSDHLQGRYIFPSPPQHIICLCVLCYFVPSKALEIGDSAAIV